MAVTKYIKNKTKNIPLKPTTHPTPLPASGGGARGWRLELEESICVVVADILNHLVDALLLIADVWDHAVLDVVADEVAESAAEVLVTWVREE